MSGLVSVVVIGIGATLIMDGWSLLLKHVFKVPSLSYCLVGRWLLHFPRGVFFHTSITKAQTMRGECVSGWIAHYIIGLFFALAFTTLFASNWIDRPTIGPALVFGLATVVFPYFLMQPALGMGVAASRAPQPAKARAKSIITHLVFGFGLYASAWLLNLTFPATA